jgi:hypothetical protein
MTYLTKRGMDYIKNWLNDGACRVTKACLACGGAYDYGVVEL